MVTTCLFKLHQMSGQVQIVSCNLVMQKMERNLELRLIVMIFAMSKIENRGEEIWSDRFFWAAIRHSKRVILEQKVSESQTDVQSISGPCSYFT